MQLVVCACVLALATAIGTCSAASLDNLRSRVEEDDDNSIHPGRKLGREPIRRRDWLKVSVSPPSVVHGALGARMEIECEVTGSPPPRVRWLRGVDAQQKAESFESNNDLGHLAGGRGLAKSRSRLVVDCLLPRDEGIYSCVATAGAKVVVAEPTMLLLKGSHASNLTALLAACPRLDDESAHAPRITSWTPVTMDEIGVDVVLPCRVAGVPAPTVFWVDAEDALLGDSDPRFKVLTSGDLLVRKIRWSDMGGYTCVATNRHGRDTAESFLYPMQNDNS